MECEDCLATTLTASLLLFPRLKRRRRDLRGASFLSTLGEKQPAFPDSTLKMIYDQAVIDMRETEHVALRLIFYQLSILMSNNVNVNFVG